MRAEFLSDHHDAPLPPITLTTPDVDRLSALLSTRVGMAYRREALRLRAELRRARIVGATEVPASVVTMNSEVTYLDVGATTTRNVTLVYPWRARERGTLNVLSPLGVALLGLQVAQRVDWSLDDGSVKVIRVLAVPYQPEANGHWHL